jgi:hypothetical protein
MRFYTPLSRNEKWYLTIFFREVGAPQPLRVGSGRIFFGGGPERTGQLTISQFEVLREPASIEVFPGAIVLAIVASEEPGIDEKFKASLSPLDEAELVRPSDIVMADAGLINDLAKGSSQLEKQLTPGRKRII